MVRKRNRCFEFFPQDLLVTPKRIREKVFKRLRKMGIVTVKDYCDMHENNYLSLEDYVMSFFKSSVNYFELGLKISDESINIDEIDDTCEFMNHVFHFIIFRKYTEPISFKIIRSEKKIFWDFIEKEK